MRTGVLRSAAAAVCWRCFRAGLLERKESWVNWDPVDDTVLANEQVIDGKGWRSGAPVEKRRLSQWFLRLTQYAPALLSALDGLDRWPDRVRTMQARWMGRSEGARVRFPMVAAVDGIAEIEVFTTRPDTLFGMSFVAIAPEHPLAAIAAAGSAEAAAFVAACRSRGTSEAVIESGEKLGFDTGLQVRHPFLPETAYPVWIANFVLMEYGTGAVFGCPAGDQRDLDFARKYGLPVPAIVLPPGEAADTFAIGAVAYDGPGTMIHSGFLDGLGTADAKRAAIDALEMAGAGARGGELAAAGLGNQPAALLGMPDPDHSLRRMRPGACPGRLASGGAAGRRAVRSARQPVGASSDLEARRVPGLWRCGRAGDGYV